jgi:hypothetical protein
LGDLQQTKQASTKCHTVSFSHPWDKPAQPPWTDWSPPVGGKKKLNNKQWNWKLAHSRGVGGCWQHTGVGGSKEPNSLRTISKQMVGEPTGGVISRCLKKGRSKGGRLKGWVAGHPQSDGSVVLRNKQWNITTGWQQQPADGSLTLSLPQRKGARQRHKPLVNKHRDKPTPKQD